MCECKNGRARACCGAHWQGAPARGWGHRCGALQGWDYSEGARCGQPLRRLAGGPWNSALQGVGGRGGLASRELGSDGMQCSVRLQGKLVRWVVCGLRSCTPRGLHPSMKHQTHARAVSSTQYRHNRVPALTCHRYRWQGGTRRPPPAGTASGGRACPARRHRCCRCCGCGRPRAHRRWPARAG